MTDTDFPETLADLLLLGALPQRPQRVQGRHKLSSPLKGSGGSGAGGGAPKPALHAGLVAELSAVDAMFRQWSQGEGLSPGRVVLPERAVGFALSRLPSSASL